MTMNLTNVEHRMSDLMIEALYRHADKNGLGAEELIPYLSAEKQAEYQTLSELERKYRAELGADI